jgi:aquaporin SIP
VIGYIVGVKLLTDIIPEIGHGPRLNVDIYRGALTEGLLTFTIAVITLGITSTKIRRSFFMKTWISSIMKLILHKLGSNLTGGCMNPASVSFQLTKFMIFNSSFFLVKRYSMLRFSKYALIMKP